MQANLYIPLKGLRYNLAGTLINDMELTDCRNIYIDKFSNLKKIEGYTAKGSNLPLNGAIMLLDQFYKTDGTEKLIAITTDDAYYYDVSANTWKYITHCYTTGTVSVTNSSATVTGSGTSWTGNVSAGDKFGVGSTDPNEITTWYTIQSVDSDTQITLASNYQGPTASGQSYCIRKLYTGDEDNLFYAEIMTDLFIATNYVNPIKKWTGSGTMTDLGGNPPRAKFIRKYKDYLVLGYVFSGTTVYPQRVQWSDTGNPEEWSTGNAGYQDLLEGVDWITGLEILGDRLIVFKERSIYSGYLVGTSEIFNFDLKVSGIGTPAPASIGNVGDELIFLGWDNIYAFNGITIEDIGEPIKDELFSTMNSEKIGNCHALIIEELDEYHLFVPSVDSTYPDTEWVYNYIRKAWYRNSRKNITRAGYYQKQSSATWDTLSGTWDSQTARWDDRVYGALSPTNLLGDSSGYVYEWDYTVNDEAGVAIDGWFTTKDFTMNDFVRRKYWARLDVYGAGNSVVVDYSTDEGNTWTNLGTLTLTAEMNWHKLDFRITSEKIRFRFRNNNSGETFKIRMLTLYWNWAGRI